MGNRRVNVSGEVFAGLKGASIFNFVDATFDFYVSLREAALLVGDQVDLGFSLL